MMTIKGYLQGKYVQWPMLKEPVQKIARSHLTQAPYL